MHGGLSGPLPRADWGSQVRGWGKSLSPQHKGCPFFWGVSEPSDGEVSQGFLVYLYSDGQLWPASAYYRSFTVGISSRDSWLA